MSQQWSNKVNSSLKKNCTYHIKVISDLSKMLLIYSHSFLFEKLLTAFVVFSNILRTSKQYYSEWMRVTKHETHCIKKKKNCFNLLSFILKWIYDDEKRQKIIAYGNSIKRKAITLFPHDDSWSFLNHNKSIAYVHNFINNGK